MNAENAAGRKTDRSEPAARRLEERMETQLELLTDAMRGSVTRADSVDGDDEYGHRRNSHIGEAVKIGAVSAQIVVALGKYAGEFNHNINVKRAGENTPQPVQAKVPPDNSLEGRAAARKRLGLGDDDTSYYELPRTSSHPPLQRFLDEYHAENDAELAAEAAAAVSGEGPVPDKTEGVPPDENAGSNG